MLRYVVFFLIDSLICYVILNLCIAHINGIHLRCLIVSSLNELIAIPLYPILIFNRTEKFNDSKVDRDL